MFEILSEDENQTYEIGFNIGSLCFKNTMIMLNGQLGAGKTTLSKGIAKGLGILDNVTSPSFAILNIYNGRLPLYHFDLYRLSDESEIYELGFDEYFEGDGVCVVEWPDNLIKFNEFLKISIFGSGDEERKIIFEANGEKHKELLYNLKKSLEKKS